MNATHIHLVGDLLAAICLSFGLFFMVVGVIGLNRFPDAYGRLHATTKCVTLGLLGFLLAAIFHRLHLAIFTKAVMTIIFVFIANPVGSHMIAKAAHKAGYKLWDKTLSDELAEDRESGRLTQPPEPHLVDEATRAANPPAADVDDPISMKRAM
ncbi:MAG: Na+/H+ antiporter subunit G [Phycisphaerales bacterium]|nr:Na+/H+ antiporter subunit G [Phycisphaerales bacterium]